MRGTKQEDDIFLTLVVEPELRMGRDNCGQQAGLGLVGFEVGGRLDCTMIPVVSRYRDGSVTVRVRTELGLVILTSVDSLLDFNCLVQLLESLTFVARGKSRLW